MKWLTFKVQQEAGFRFNLIDLIFIALLSAISLGLKIAVPDLSLFGIPLYVGFSFFLFCNVFRIGNRAEAWWYVPFAALAVSCIYTMRLDVFWWVVLLILEPLKAGLIIRAMRRCTYHGAFHQRLQPPQQPPLI